MANKIKYGLKNAYYSVITVDSETGEFTYGTPVALKGAVSISLEQQGDINKFYADDMVYWQTAVNNGYEGDLEIALIPDSFYKDVLGMTEDNNDMLVEHNDQIGKQFALLFEFTHDDKATRHVFYNCTATRPSVASQTKQETIEPQTETITISAVPNDNGYVKASAAYGTDNYSTWFTTVPVPDFTT